MVFNKIETVLSGSTSIILNKDVYKDLVLRQGFYRFIGTESALIQVAIYVNQIPINAMGGSSSNLWVNYPVWFGKKIQNGDNIKIVIVNNSADPITVQVLLDFVELERSSKVNKDLFNDKFLDKLKSNLLESLD
ncbi:MAG: hypothetical protein ACOCV8_01870 [Spirochaetota bacterium]